MPPTSQIIVVIFAVAVAVGALCARTWSALSWAGRRAEARRYLWTMVVCTTGLMALAAGAGVLVQFDIVAYHARASAGQAPWDRLYGACLLLGAAVILWLMLRRATCALQPPAGLPKTEDDAPGG